MGRSTGSSPGALPGAGGEFFSAGSSSQALLKDAGWGGKDLALPPSPGPRRCPCHPRGISPGEAGGSGRAVPRRGHNGVLCVRQRRCSALRRGTLGYCAGQGEQQQLRLVALSSPGCLCPGRCARAPGPLHPALSRWSWSLPAAGSPGCCGDLAPLVPY